MVHQNEAWTLNEEGYLQNYGNTNEISKNKIRFFCSKDPELIYESTENKAVKKSHNRIRIL